MSDLITSILPTRGLSHDAATERVVSFTQQFGETHMLLACHAAFPLALTPDLLYQIWAKFVPEAPWTAVSDVLLSSLCQDVGYELYEMNATVRNLLLKELKENILYGQQRLYELADFLTEYVMQQIDNENKDVRDLAQAQQWTALAYTRLDDAAREMVLAFSRVDLENKPELFRLASLVETMAEPLELRFRPLLVYARGMTYFASGDLNNAEAQFRLLNEESQSKNISINLPLPESMLDELAKQPSIVSRKNGKRFESRIETQERIPIYFSHSYRPEDKYRNLFFYELFGDKGYFSVDIKPNYPQEFDNTYLEWRINHCDCFIAVIPKRWGGEGLEISPYQLYEYDLAVRANKPRILFVESGIPKHFFQGLDDDSICFFDPIKYVEQKPIFQEKFTRLFFKAYAMPFESSIKPVALLTNPLGTYTSDVIKAIKDGIEKCGFPFYGLIDPSKIYSDYEFLQKVEACEFLISEVRPSFVPTDIFASVYNRCIPTIKICHLSETETEDHVSQEMGLLFGQERNWDIKKWPPELRGLQLDNYSRPVLFWHTTDELVEQLAYRLEKMSEHSEHILTLSDVKRYFLSIGRRQEKIFISNTNSQNKFVAELKEELREQGISYFHYERDAIPIGSTNWLKGLIREIDNATVFIALITPDYLNSKWCQRELNRAVSRYKKNKIAIYPYVMDETIRWPKAIERVQGRYLADQPQEQQVEIIVQDLIRFLEASVEEGNLNGFQLEPKLRTIMFDTASNASAIEVSTETDPELIIDLMGLSPFDGLISIHGGARPLPSNIYPNVMRLISAVVELAFERNIMIIDGGTQAGVVEMVGTAFNNKRLESKSTIYPPLVGIVPTRKVRFTSAKNISNNSDAVDLDPNHPYFVLVNDAEKWGDEMVVMFNMLNLISQKVPSVDLFIDGGLNTLATAEWSVRNNREIIVLDGSQRTVAAIVAAVDGASEKNLLDILLSRETQLISSKGEESTRALKQLKIIASYNRIIRFNVKDPPEVLKKIIDSRFS